LNFVLDEVCARLPNGGEQESRRYIAEQLIEVTRAGRVTLEDLRYAGRKALAHLNGGPRAV
jgi:hypothetical protein